MCEENLKDIVIWGDQTLTYIKIILFLPHKYLKSVWLRYICALILNMVSFRNANLKVKEIYNIFF